MVYRCVQGGSEYRSIAEYERLRRVPAETGLLIWSLSKSRIAKIPSEKDLVIAG